VGARRGRIVGVDVTALTASAMQQSRPRRYVFASLVCRQEPAASCLRHGQANHVSAGSSVAALPGRLVP